MITHLSPDKICLTIRLSRQRLLPAVWLALAVFLGLTGRPALAQGPVIHLPFDEPPGVTSFVDISGNGYDAVCVTSAICPTSGAAGQYGAAVQFDGVDDYLRAGSVNLANRSFTLAAWAKRNSINTYDLLLTQGPEAINYALHFGFRPDNTFTCAFWGNDLDSPAYTDTNWHHWACTYDAATNRRTIYRDGVQVAQDIAAADYQGSGDLIVGTIPFRTDRFFDGLADEVQVFDQELSAVQVQGLMATPNMYPVAGLSTGLQFDGVNDYVALSPGTGKVPAASLNLPGQEMTVEAWVNVTQFKNWAGFVGFLQDNAASEWGWALGTWGAPAGFYFAVSTSGTGMTYLSDYTVQPDRWYHLAGTYDGATMRLYIDGVEVNSSTAQSGPIAYADSWYRLGSYKDDNEDIRIEGMMDEVRVWNVARSQTAIQANMFQRLSGSEPGLVGHWTLDEGAGSTAYDSTGNHDGALTGPPDWVLAGKLNLTFSTTKNTPVSDSLTGHDPDNDLLTYTIVDPPNGGTVQINDPLAGTFTYTPFTNFTGPDMFTYQVTDPGGLSDIAFVIIEVLGTNLPPTALADAATTAEDTPLTISPLTNDSDPDGDALSINAVGLPQHGTTNCQASMVNCQASIVYTPAPNFNGVDVFSYSVTDGSFTAAASITVTVTAVADAPLAVADATTINENNPAVLYPLANDSDPDGDSLSLTHITSPLSGSAIISGSTVVYTPTLDFAGQDVFSYTVSDGTFNASASYRVNVMHVNRAPLAVADTATTSEDTALTISPLTNDSDPDGDTLTISAVGTPQHGTTNCLSSSVNCPSSIIYTPALNFNGTDVFTYRVTDGQLFSSGILTVNVSPVNDAPVIGLGSATTVFMSPNGAPIPFALTLSASDPDGDPLGWLTGRPANHGVMSISPGPGHLTAAISYTPTTDYSGVDDFAVQVSDGRLTKNIDITVTIQYLQGPIYVDARAAGANNGSSWANAFRYLQDALDLANADGGHPHEIWVAKGVYYPDEDSNGDHINNSATEYFTLRHNNVKLYGGFAGTETQLSQRDWAANPTILSGDIDRNDANSDGNHIAERYTDIQGSNAGHVLYLDGETHAVIDGATVIDGFTITGGGALGTIPGNDGGGLYCAGSGSGHGCSPSLANLMVSGNSAAWGGGLYNDGSNSGQSSPSLVNVSFAGNYGYIGGGLHNTGKSGGQSSPSLVNVSFVGNKALNGGGMFNNGSNSGVSSPSLVNVVFSRNTANNDGGGMFNSSSVSSIGGVSQPVLVNVTFSNNSAYEGGGIYNYSDGSNPSLTNVILWGNTAAGSGPQIGNLLGSPTFKNCLVQGGVSGLGADLGGNLNADPRFADAAADNLRLAVNSPAVDAGDSSALPADVYDLDGDSDTIEILPVDLAGSRRSLGSNVDIGAYESATVLYVDTDATGANNGSSWANAYKQLYDALQYASFKANTQFEIWVAEGVYYTHPAGVDNRSIGLSIDQDNVQLYGGFSGVETLRSQRDWTAHLTIISGDYDKNDVSTNGVVTQASNIIGANSYVVLALQSSSPNTVVDGFTLTAADNRDSVGYGAGLACYTTNGDCKPTLANLTISGNRSSKMGGGFYCYGTHGDCSPSLTNVTFHGNAADRGGGMFIYSSYGYRSNPRLVDVTFDGNSATSDGGGLYIDSYHSDSSPSLSQVTFRNNSAFYGGGFFTKSDFGGTNHPSLSHVTFAGNSASYGGGMYNLSEGTGSASSPSLTHVSFSGNSASGGGGLYNRSARYGVSSPSLTSVIFSRNSASYGGGGMVNDSSGDSFSQGYGDSSPRLVNVIFHANQSNSSGGGLQNSSSDNGVAKPVLINVTFVDNSARLYGGGIDNDYPNLNLRNVILWGNTANGGGAQVYNSIRVSTDLPVFFNSLIQGSSQWDFWMGIDGGGNLDADPRFVEAATGDLRLLSGSPAIDGGDNGNCPAADFNDAPRSDGACDIGATEYIKPTILRVDGRVASSGSGDAWGEGRALKYLQDALDLANANGSAGYEIWVVGGVYYPDEDINGDHTHDSANEYFTLRYNNVQLYGGFAGAETDRSQRDRAAQPTILSGDIDGNDANSDGNHIAETANDVQGRNAYHVLYLDGETNEAINYATVIDGFTITAGQADGSSTRESSGGGLYCAGSGSGHKCSPSLANLAFSGNFAFKGGGMDNEAGDGGVSSPSLVNVTFAGNSASQDGGGMANRGYDNGVSSPSLVNVVFSGNSASSGGGIYNLGLRGGVSSPSLVNAILWGNTATASGPQVYNSSATPTFAYSLVQGGISGLGIDGGGNLSANPLFVDAGNGDLRLAANSPAIDAGDNTAVSAAADLAGNSRFYDDVGVIDTGHGSAPLVDLGAYERQSDSPFAEMTLAGSGLTITDGDTSPSLADLTDFGHTPFGSVLSHTFIISNSGALSLTLTGSPAVTLAAGSAFTVTQPATTTLPGGSSASFVLTFQPPAVGSFADTVSMANNDLDENPYTFAVRGVADCPAGPIYVNRRAAGRNNGTSWVDAYADLQTGLSLARQCAPIEVWVASGVYTPGLTQSDTFTITAGVRLYGGFAATETLRSQRNWAANPTILSGDIGGDDVTTAGGVVTTSAHIVGGNSDHVVYAAGRSGAVIDSGTVLDGFTITAGQADGADPHNKGGGFYCAGGGSGNKCSPSLPNLIFSGNTAASGGGLYNEGSSGGQSSPDLTNVIFTGNMANYGGAMYNSGYNGGSSPRLVNASLSRNSATVYGGGLYSAGSGSKPGLTNVIVWENTAGFSGPQVYNASAAPTFANSLVQGGIAGLGTDGGGNLSANPLFVDAGNGDLRLAANSPAIDAGKNSALTAAADLAGQARFYDDQGVTDTGLGTGPIVDLGAYETQTDSPVIDLTLLGNGLVIRPGDASPSPADGTDFGRVVLSKTMSRTFTISNSGQAALTLTGAPAVALAAGQAFAVTQPASATLPGGHSASFAISFVPPAAGPFTDTVTIATNDPDKNPYTFVISSTGECPPSPIYVDRRAAGHNTGSSWADAYPDLQTALNLARQCAPLEVWVAEGVYTPGLSRSDTFTLTAGVQLYGGFAGNETQRSQRDWAANPTILSGDIGGDDLTTASGVVITAANIVGNNSYHVVYASNLSGTAVTGGTSIDGFTITAGQANGNSSAYSSGGGLFIRNSGRGNIYGLSLTNVTFTGNMAVGSGGGIYNLASSSDSSPSLTNVSFAGNLAIHDGGGMYNYSYSGDSSPSLTGVSFAGNSAANGGGLYNYSYTGGTSSPSLSNVTFSQNTASDSGGAMYSEVSSGGVSSPSLSQVTFSNNSAGYGGGGVYSSNSTLGLSHITFSDNSASSFGGGLYSRASSLNLSHVTFSHNTIPNNGNGGGLYSSSSNLNLSHVTFSHNTVTGVSITSGIGGGMYSDAGSLSLSDVTFTGNTASRDGGGMNSVFNSPSLSRVTFTANTANNNGGGLSHHSGNLNLIDVIFISNTASYYGGGMYLSNNAGNSDSVRMINATIYGNKAFYGGGIYNRNSNLNLVNTILWGNSAGSGPQVYNTSTTPTFAYSLVQGSGGSGSWNSSLGIDGGGNLSADPRFVNAANGDLRLAPHSPAIDAGNNGVITATTDLSGSVRFYDDLGVPDTGLGVAPLVDLGAYERQSDSPALDIVVLANGLEISAGDTSPSLADRTDFGRILFGGGLTHTFTISNGGEMDVLLTGSPRVALVAGGAFAVTQPASAAIPSGHSAGFAIRFVPPAVGRFTDTVSIASNDPDENPYTFVISGTGYNAAPILVDDSAATDEDTPLTLNPLSNDSDPNGDSLTISAVGSPVYGAAVISGAGQIVYTPTNRSADYTAVFTYSASDGSLSGVGAISVAVSATNEAPQLVMTDQGWQQVGSPGFSPASVSQLSHALDGSRQPLIAFPDYSRNNKATVMHYNGSIWEYVGSPGFSTGSIGALGLAVDSSSQPVVAFKDNSRSGKATVMRYNGSAWTTVGSSGFSAGAVDYVSLALDNSDRPVVAFQDQGNGSKATVMRYSGSKWETIGNPGFSAGSAWFITLALDSGGWPLVAFTDGANGNKVTVMRFNGSQWETVGAPGFSAGDGFYLSLARNDSDQPVVAFRDGGNGYRASVMRYSGSAWEYVGNPGFSAGPASDLSLKLDGSGQPVVAFSTSVMRYSGSAWEYVGSARFSTGSASDTSLALDGRGNVFVAFQDGTQGYKATVARYFIRYQTHVEVTMSEDNSPTPFALTLTANDPDGDPLIWSISSAASHGVASASGTGNSKAIDYTPDQAYKGDDSFVVQVSDGNLADAVTVNVTILARNDPPQMVDDSAVTDENTPITLSPLSNDSDLNGDSLTISAVGAPGYGTATRKGNDQIIYTPANRADDYTAVFTYTASDNRLATASATISVAVKAIDEAPQLVMINQDWQMVGSPGFTPGNVDDLSMALDGSGNIFVAFKDFTRSSKATVMRYTGSGWEYVGQPGFSYSIENPRLVVDSAGRPVVAFSMWTGNGSKATVMRYTGSGWEYVGNPGFSVGSATYLSLALDSNDRPVVAFRDNNYRAKVMRYSGSAWQVVGGADFSPGTALYLSLALDDGDQPVVAYADNTNLNKATVIRYTGSAWEYVGQPGFSAGAIKDASLVLDGNGRPVVAFSDGGSSSKATVMRYSGSAWEHIGSPGFSAAGVDYTSLALDSSGRPTVAFRDIGSSYEATVMRYSGSAWEYVGSRGFSSGTANYINLIRDNNGNFFVSFSVGMKATVMRYLIYCLPEIEVTMSEDSNPTPFALTLNAIDPEGSPLTWSINSPAGHGAATIGATGSLTAAIGYIPNRNYSGADSFAVQVSDGSLVDTVTVKVTIEPVDTPITAVDDAAATSEDTPVTLFVLSNDLDPAGQAIISAVGLPQHGTTNCQLSTLNCQSSITYTPDANFHGVDVFTYTAATGRLSDTATVTVTVSPVDDPPTAVDDSQNTPEDTPLTFSPLTNDSDPDGDPLTLVSAGPATQGTVTIVDTQTLRYAPPANYSGPDSLLYTVSDAQGQMATAKVTLDVTAVNDAPDAVADSASTDEDQSVVIDLLLNDSDVESDTLTIDSLDPAHHGTVTLSGNGTVTYTPDPDYFGGDSFAYNLSDGQGGTDKAPVAVTINPVNDAPVANDDSGISPDGSAITIDPLSNDSDAEGDSLSISAVGLPQHGTTNCQSSMANTQNAGTGCQSLIVYTPNPGASGLDSFSYELSDGQGGTDTATVQVIVNPQSGLITAVDDQNTTYEDKPVTLDALANDSGANLSLISVTAPQHGTAEISGGQVIYSPAANYHGPDQFAYAISDGGQGYDTATVSLTVLPVNDPPDAVDDSRATNEDTLVTLDVLANDSDPDGDSLSIVSASQPGHGTVALSGTLLLYRPQPGYAGADNFSYTISDGQNGLDTATVQVTVTAVNDPPDAVADTATTAEDTPVSINVLFNDTDPEDDPLTVTGVTQGQFGTVTTNSNGTVVYRPNKDYNGQDSFTYSISDTPTAGPGGQDGTDTATVRVTITPVADEPTPNPDAAIVPPDQPVTFNPAGNDVDADGNSLCVGQVSQAGHGTVGQNPDSSVSYTPNSGFSGTDSFTYTLQSCTSGSSISRVSRSSISAQAGVQTGQATLFVGLPPTVNAGADNPTTAEDTPLVIPALSNDSGSGALSLVGVTQPPNGTVIISGTNLLYTPDLDFSGSDVFSYTVSNGSGYGIGTVTVTVTPVNDAPNARDDTDTTVEEQAVTIDLLGNDSDRDSGGSSGLTISHVTYGQHGTVVDNLDGTVTYTPDRDYYGSDSFAYTIEDSTGASDRAVVEVTISNVNDAPVANQDLAQTAEDRAVVIQPLRNDWDVDDDRLRLSGCTAPAHGTAVVHSDGTVTYTPAADYYGSDSFTCTVDDTPDAGTGGQGGSVQAPVQVTVSPVNDAPVAVADQASLSGGAATVDVLANDSDVDGDPLLVTAIGPAGQGTVVNHGDGTVTYSAGAGFSGTDVFTYTVEDGNGGTATARVDIDGQAGGGRTLYFPLLLRRQASGLDLVIDSLSATENGVTLVIRNRGSGPVEDAFWVDVYFDPSEPPTVNQTWNSIAPAGVTWGVTVDIPAGGALTLTSGDAYYFPQYSSSPPFPLGAPVYAYVDSVDHSTSHGTVRESDESNNLAGPQPVTAGGSAAAEWPGSGPDLDRLPER